MIFTVIFELAITAESPEEAAKFALDDLRDPSIRGWNATVKSEQGTVETSVSVEPNGMHA